MPQRWVGLIRGINVGTAKRVAMADLRAWVVELGFEDVSTLLNSGNVVFSRPGSSGRSPAPELERAIGANAGFSAAVVALSAAELDAVVRGNTLASPSRDPSRLLVAAVRTPADLRRLGPLAGKSWGAEELACGKVAAYLWCPDGVAKSALVVEVGKLLGDAVTMRNWATVLKLHAAAGSTARANAQCSMPNAQGRKQSGKAQSRVAASRIRR